MQSIDLNCDMGEGMLHDAAIMPFISSANIACGYHAGDPSILCQTILLAMQHKVAIGAHPGFADKTNFGRTEITLSQNGYYDLIIDQLQIFKKAADELGAKIHHIKPHGALYNMSARDVFVAQMIAQAVFDFDASLILYGLSGSHSITEAKSIGLQTCNEVFADRTYQNDGSLTPRSKSNALIADEQACLQQVLQMVQYKTVTTVDQTNVQIDAETICLHGDGEHAASFAALINQTLTANQIIICAK
jgi:5-oxoprolinase (ATP-hydrolysing) subunit A